MILVVAEPGDPHVSSVVRRLHAARSDVAVVDVPDLARHADVELEIGLAGVARRIRLGDRTIDLDDVTVAWWRRLPVDDVRPEAALLPGGGRSETLESVLDSLAVSWVNEPLRDRRARRRPDVWAAAQQSGLALPHTLVTRDPARAHEFARDHAEHGVLATSLLRRADDWGGAVLIDDADSVAAWVGGAPAETALRAGISGVDVRVVVVGSAMFAVEVDRGDDLPLELALAGDDVRRADLPDDVFDGVLGMLERLGLATASVDLRRTPEGQHVLLDVDPAPQWGSIERATGWPITIAMADALLTRERVVARA